MKRDPNLMHGTLIQLQLNVYIYNSYCTQRFPTQWHFECVYDIHFVKCGCAFVYCLKSIHCDKIDYICILITFTRRGWWWIKFINLIFFPFQLCTSISHTQSTHTLHQKKNARPIGYCSSHERYKHQSLLYELICMIQLPDTVIKWQFLF